ncbi:MAG: C4-dicarboxylate ABC transporter [Campylobacteraceae bacterium 4484_4]|nr:MAG: C4-dicarboxylate ABC transporter [Campylobacteraceae bacterium 4484_4]
MSKIGYAVTLIETLVKRSAQLAALLVVLLSALIVYDAVNRYLFQSGSVALQELEWHLFDIIFLLGLSYTLQHDKHVRVDIFYTRFSPRTKALINIVSQLFLVLPFTALILYMSYTFIEQSYLQNEISSDPGGLTHRWMIKGVIAVGFVLLGLQSLCEIYKNVQIFKRHTV